MRDPVGVLSFGITIVRVFVTAPAAAETTHLAPDRYGPAMDDVLLRLTLALVLLSPNAE